MTMLEAVKNALNARYTVNPSKDVLIAMKRADDADENALNKGIEIIANIANREKAELINAFAINDNKAKTYIPVKGLIKAIALFRFIGGEKETVLDNHLKIYLVEIVENTVNHRIFAKNKKTSEFNLYDMKNCQTWRSGNTPEEMADLINENRPNYSTSTSNTQVSQIKTVFNALGLMTGKKFGNNKMSVNEDFIKLIEKRVNEIHVKTRSNGWTTGY